MRSLAHKWPLQAMGTFGSKGCEQMPRELKGTTRIEMGRNTGSNQPPVAIIIWDS